jgi:hypothetical protein
MTKAFQTGVGDKIKVYVALLPKGSRVAPVDVEVTVSTGGGALATETSIGVTALSGAIAKGTPLVFSGGTKAYLAADAATGATTLTVEPLSGAIADAETADFIAKTRLLGGTQADLSLGNTTTDVLVFEDPGGYNDGAVTGSSWSISWSAQELLDDATFEAIEYNARNANSGQEIYIWHESATPTGATTGRTYHGPSIIEGFDMSRPSDGLLTYSCTFQGRGTPNFDRAE